MGCMLQDCGTDQRLVARDDVPQRQLAVVLPDRHAVDVHLEAVEVELQIRQVERESAHPAVVVSTAQARHTEVHRVLLLVGLPQSNRHCNGNARSLNRAQSRDQHNFDSPQLSEFDSRSSQSNGLQN